LGRAVSFSVPRLEPTHGGSGRRTSSDRLARSPVETAAWAAAFRATYGATHEVHEVSVGPSTLPDAHVTLMRPQSGPVHLQLPYLWEPGDLLFRDPPALTALAGQLVALRLPLRLSRLPQSSPTAPALSAAARRSHGLLLLRETVGWPGLELRSGIDPERVLNAGRRSDLRRARRRAAALGELTFDLLTPTPAQVPALLEEAWRVEAASWKRAAGTALALDPERGSFFAHYLTHAAGTGSARIAFARVSGHAVAMQLAACVDNRLWLLKIGFDEAYGLCSPGQLLMLEVLHKATAEGLAGLELMGTPEPWTRMWTQAVRPCVNLRYYPPTSGSLPALADDLRCWLR
jgi:hypothetical protein